MSTLSLSKAILLLIAFCTIILTIAQAPDPTRAPSPSQPSHTPEPRGNLSRKREAIIARCNAKKDAFKKRKGFLSGAEQVCCYFGPNSGLCKPLDKYKDEEKSCAVYNSGVGDPIHWNCCVTKKAADKFIYICTGVKGPLDCNECSEGCKLRAQHTSTSVDENLTIGTELRVRECASSSEASLVSEKGAYPSASRSSNRAKVTLSEITVRSISCCGGGPYPDQTWCLLICGGTAQTR